MKTINTVVAAMALSTLSFGVFRGGTGNGIPGTEHE